MNSTGRKPQTSRSGRIPYGRWVLLLLWVLSPALGQRDGRQSYLTEYTVKGTWLYQFIKFIDFPGGLRTDVINIGIIGESPFGDMFDPLIEQGYLGRRFRIKIYEPGDLDANLAECQLVFVPYSDRKSLAAIADRLKGKPVLIVTENEGALEKGAMINFVNDYRNESVRYEINRKTLATADLKISSQILGRALKVVN